MDGHKLTLSIVTVSQTSMNIHFWNIILQLKEHQNDVDTIRLLETDLIHKYELNEIINLIIGTYAKKIETIEEDISKRIINLSLLEFNYESSSRWNTCKFKIFCSTYDTRT